MRQPGNGVGAVCFSLGVVMIVVAAFKHAWTSIYIHIQWKSTTNFFAGQLASKSIRAAFKTQYMPVAKVRSLQM